MAYHTSQWLRILIYSGQVSLVLYSAFMIYHNRRSVPYYSFENLDSYPELQHAVFTRHGGVSPPPWDSLNLGWAVGDDNANVEANYRHWTLQFGIARDDLATTHQVHGNEVLVAGAEPMGDVPGRADAMITATPLLPLTQRYADCTPILMFDPVKHACGIAHAGWRGTVARCAESTVQAMHSQFGSDPADLVAAVGPAIGPCCYEVGAEVVSAIERSQRQPEQLLSRPSNEGGVHLDLWTANATQLEDAGVGSVEVAELCTSCHRHIFFSHRGDGGKSGRFAAFIMLNTP